VRLFKKDGSYNLQTSSALDNLANSLKDKNHILESSYKATHVKILINFNCGHESHWITPNDYKSGYGCPKCAGLCPIQAEEDFKQLLEKNGHKLLTEYVNAQTKVKIDYNCGHQSIWLKPNGYKNGRGCPKCSGKCPIQAKEKFQQMVGKAGYKLLGEYKAALTKVKLQCDKGHVIEIQPNNFTANNARCLKCAGHCPKQFKENSLKLIKENGHEMLSEYVNDGAKIEVNFNCGHQSHWLKPNSYKNGNRCPLCRESRGERVIREYLETNGIVYKSQYKFPNDNREYDFYLPLENTIVEVHGQQHYEEVKFFRLSLEEEQLNDKQKKECAESFGCKYIVVDYREGKPELAIERFIASYKQIKEKELCEIIQDELTLSL